MDVRTHKLESKRLQVSIDMEVLENSPDVEEHDRGLVRGGSSEAFIQQLEDDMAKLLSERIDGFAGIVHVGTDNFEVRLV